MAVRTAYPVGVVAAFLIPARSMPGRAGRGKLSAGGHVFTFTGVKTSLRMQKDTTATATAMASSDQKSNGNLRESGSA